MIEKQISQKLRGKRAVATGAADALGLAIAERLVAEGARVAAWDKSAEALDAAFGTKDSDAFAPSVVNVLASREVQQSAGQVLAAFGGVDNRRDFPPCGCHHRDCIAQNGLTSEMGRAASSRRGASSASARSGVHRSFDTEILRAACGSPFASKIGAARVMSFGK